MSHLRLKILGCLALIAGGVGLASSPRGGVAEPRRTPRIATYPTALTAAVRPSREKERAPERAAPVAAANIATPIAIAAPAAPVAAAAAVVAAMPRASYAGATRGGIPRYMRREFTTDERALLRDYFGIADPSRLYLSDSSPAGYLRYDTEEKRCRECFVNTHIVGAPALRRPGETWEALEARVRRMSRRDFPASALVPTESLDELDPAARDAFRRLLADARRAGFPVHVVETYRSPVRSAFLMWIGRGRTRTLTSSHSLGRAVDIAVTRGNPRRARPSAQWVRFRRWVTQYDGGRFGIIGTPSGTWDWGHVELRTPSVGFRSIEDLLGAARACDERTRELRATDPDAPLADCSFEGRRAGGRPSAQGRASAADSDGTNRAPGM